MSKIRHFSTETKKSKLTCNQLKAITSILESNSIEEAAKRSGLSRSSIYIWMKQDHFIERLRKAREELFNQGLDVLRGAVARATKVLVRLLDCNDRNTKRLAAKTILEMAFKANEIKQLEERISQIEEILEQDKYKQKRYWVPN